MALGRELAELLSIRPHSQLVSARIFEMKPPPTWKLEGLLCDFTAGVSNRLKTPGEILRVQND